MSQIIKLEKYSVEITESLNIHQYHAEDYSGVAVTIDNECKTTYDICLNNHLGARLIISDSNGSNKDVPFSEKTMCLLPACIIVRSCDE